MKRNLFSLIIIFFFAFWGIKALLHPGFYTSHDGYHQLIRLMHFDRGLKDGQFPVRWAGKAMAGYGYPLFIFTYRLPFWAGEFWRLLDHSLVDSVKFSFILAYFLSGLAMFLFLNDFLKNKTATFLGTLAFLWAPYRFSDIYVRASLGESYCFVFLPLIFWSFYRLRKGFEKKFFLLGAFSLAFLLLSHALIFWLVLPFVFLWWFYLFFQNRKERINFVRSSLLILLFSSCLSCYYWLPALIEKKNVIFSQILQRLFFHHFPTFRQLLYSPWGYGLSVEGPEDAMSFQVGLSFWFAFFTAGLIIFCRFLQKKKLIFDYLLFFVVCFLLALFLILPYSAFIWRLVMKVLVVDFSWRYLLMTTFLGAVIMGLAYKNLKPSWLRFLFFLGCLFLIIYGNRNHLRVNLYLDYPDKTLQKSTATSNSYDDYKPISLIGQKISADDPLFYLYTGKADFQVLKENSYQLNFKAQVKTPQAEIFLRKTWYPGWQSLVDGQKTKVLNCGGKVCFKLSSGEHFINLWFTETKLRLLADFISLFSLLSVIFWFIHSRIRMQARKKYD